ncbi:MAG: ribonuclease M5 [Methanobrevibacter sp.]|nr:ribonuclease M5 [Methanobrevibacter sp.]
MIIVVEGKNDANKLKSIFKDVDIIITNGSEISKQTIETIVKASLIDDVVLCLDPDGPGEKIRRKILEHTTNVHQVFAKKEKAISNNKKKIGIEHMNKEDILDMFNDIKINKKEKTVSYMDLYILGYMESKEKRSKLCDKLNISYCNGKQLLKRINMFGITLEEIKKHDC